MKKYRITTNELVAWHESHKYGAVLEQHGNYLSTAAHDNCNLMLPMRLLQFHPDWFEEIKNEKPEFTRSDMSAFGYFCLRWGRDESSYLIDQLLEDWLNHLRK